MSFAFANLTATALQLHTAVAVPLSHLGIVSPGPGLNYLLNEQLQRQDTKSSSIYLLRIPQVPLP